MTFSDVIEHPSYYLLHHRRTNALHDRRYIAVYINGDILDGLSSPTDGFMSHDWSFDLFNRNNHQKVSRINQKLKMRGIKTWFDDYDRYDVENRYIIRSGIDNTKCFLVFITETYYN